ncbi:MAG: hypothetical protein JWQ03_3118 [Variovorax sp.]|nr:hypothetical protein [Variovorax sp.]
MEEVVRSKLLGTAPIAALVQTRIDWGERSQGTTLPAIVLHLISDIPEMKMAGPSGWSDARVQVDNIGRTIMDAVRVRRAVLAAMLAWYETIDGKKYRAFVIDSSTNPDTDQTGTLHRARLDLRISYQS